MEYCGSEVQIRWHANCFGDEFMLQEYALKLDLQTKQKETKEQSKDGFQ